MKTLSYFLWLCVVGLVGYVAYFFLTTTNFREKDLVVVGQQNFSLQTIMRASQNQVKWHTVNTEKTVKKRGNVPKEVAIFQKGKEVQSLSKQYIQKVQVACQEKKWQLVAEQYTTYCQLMSKIDTSLRDFSEPYYLYIPSQLQPNAFQDNYLLAIQSEMIRVANKGSERIFSKLSIGCGFLQMKAYTMPHTNLVKEGQFYNASLALISSYSPMKLNMKIASKNIKTNGNEGEISIPYQPIKFDANGQSKQKIDAQITFKKSYKAMNDTTIYLSTSYTVKRKK